MNGSTILGTATVSSGSATFTNYTVPNVGSYNFFVNYLGDDSFSPSQSGTTAITIAQAAPTFSGLTASQTITYGTATIDVAGTLSSPTAIPAGQDVTVTIDGAGTTAVVGDDGSFTATIDTATLPASATPYTIAYGYAADANFQAASDSTTTLTVNRATATLSFDASSLTQTYDGTARVVTVTTTPAALSGVSITYDGSTTVPTDAGSYALSATLTNANYQADPITGTLTVAQAGLTITADNQTKVYGAALPTLTASYSGFVNGDTSASLTTQPTLTTTATASSPVGPYPITASGAVGANYSISDVSGTLTIIPAIILSPTTLPVGVPYSQQLRASGGSGPATASRRPGSQPAYR